MTTSEQARQMMERLREDWDEVPPEIENICSTIESLLEQLALKDLELSVYIEIAKVLDETGTAQALKAIREAMNADYDYKSPGNAR